jgi:hypothetical protein
MTEDQEQMLFVQWWRRNRDERIFAIPNGGHRHPAVAAKLKVTGTVAGVPDLYVPALHLWIEMKIKTGGRLSPVQKDWIAYLESIGDKVIVGLGWEDTVNKLQQLGFVPIK